MRHLKLVSAFVAVLTFPIGYSHAETLDRTFTGGDLKSACEDRGSKICSAYIAGYAQGFYYSSVSAQAGFTPCLAPGLNEPKARLITTKFMDDHPEAMAQGAASVVAEALVSAFPCVSSR